MEVKNIAHLFIGSVFLVLGLNSAINGFDGYVSMIESKGIPFAMFVAILVLAFKIIAGFSIITNNYNNNIIIGLIAFTLAATLLYHNVVINKNELTSFMKNIGLIGGLLMLYK